MKGAVITNKKFDVQELSNTLAGIARSLPESARFEEGQIREQVIDFLKRGRYEFGKILHKYRSVYKEKEVWVQAAKAIADQLGCSERTLYRIIKDYERGQEIPAVFRAALKAEGYDPTAKKNERILEAVFAMCPIDRQLRETEARALVRRAATIVKEKKQRNEKLSGAERRHWHLRMDLRRLLEDIPDEQKPNVLSQAIAEEAFDVWGCREPFTMQITPKQGQLRIDGRIRSLVEVAA